MRLSTLIGLALLLALTTGCGIFTKSEKLEQDNAQLLVEASQMKQEISALKEQLTTARKEMEARADELDPVLQALGELKQQLETAAAMDGKVDPAGLARIVVSVRAALEEIKAAHKNTIAKIRHIEVRVGLLDDQATDHEDRARDAHGTAVELKEEARGLGVLEAVLATTAGVTGVGGLVYSRLRSSQQQAARRRDEEAEARIEEEARRRRKAERRMRAMKESEPAA